MFGQVLAIWRRSPSNTPGKDFVDPNGPLDWLHIVFEKTCLRDAPDVPSALDRGKEMYSDQQAEKASEVSLEG